MENDIVRMLFLRRQRQKKRWKIKTISGAPPLSFKAKAGALKDYRIYGNTANGESVGDLETTGEHAGEYKVPVTVSNGDDTQTIPIYLPEQSKKVGDEAEYIDYAEQKQHRVRKNFLDENSLISPMFDLSWYFDDEHYLLATNKTIDSRQWGYDYSQFHIALSSGTYTLQLSGIAATIQYSGVYITKSNNEKIYSENITDKSNIVITFTLNTPDIIGIEIKVFDGKYRIMLNTGSTPLPYEPYVENTDLDVILPELPTLKGTNVMTVGTAVQPSDVYIKGRIKKGE